jgi:hypothetical protein
MEAGMRRMLWIGVVGLVGAPGCAVDPIPGDSSNCVEHHDRILTATTPADPPLQFRIGTCQLDIDACQGLCDLLMTRNGITATSTTCAVAIDPLSVSVHVTYDQQSNGTNCARPESLGGSGQTNGTPQHG